MQISNRVESLAASQTLAMSQKSAELKAQGIDVINPKVSASRISIPRRISRPQQSRL